MSSTGLVILLLVLAVGMIRLGWLTWIGLRTGRVKPAAFWQPHLDRRQKPRLYWITIVSHLTAIISGLVIFSLFVIEPPNV